jgi:murein DD-endopeptidase MepM/ murein hydrolase activator NlpD
MRNPVPAFRSRTVLNVVTVACLAAAAAACSNSARFHDGLFTGSTPNQREIIGSAVDQPMPPPISGGSGTVTRAALPPPPPTSTTVASADQPMPAAVPGYGSDGYAWSAVGGMVVTVQRGETLNDLAVKYGAPPSQILNANQLTSAAQIAPGRILVIPHRVALAPSAPSAPEAPVVLAQASPQPALKAGATYVVRSGDTLYSIGRHSGASVDELVSLNGLASPDQIRVGQTLKLPAGASAPAAVAYAPAAKPTVKPHPVASPKPMIKLKSPAETVASAPPVPPTPTVPVQTGPTPTATVAAAVIDDTADPPSANGTSFRWPVRGRIISGFGSKPNGERNDGINLAVPEGTSVKAAEAGTVIYAGNELEGYGNLILIRHADGWVSAYAHNENIMVKRGDTVRRGEIIAHAGMSGSVTAPQVHFELRKGAKPVNPLDYLAG